MDKNLAMSYIFDDKDTTPESQSKIEEIMNEMPDTAKFQSISQSQVFDSRAERWAEQLLENQKSEIELLRELTSEQRSKISSQRSKIVALKKQASQGEEDPIIQSKLSESQSTIDGYKKCVTGATKKLLDLRAELE